MKKMLLIMTSASLTGLVACTEQPRQSLEEQTALRDEVENEVLSTRKKTEMSEEIGVLTTPLPVTRPETHQPHAKTQIQPRPAMEFAYGVMPTPGVMPTRDIRLVEQPVDTENYEHLPEQGIQSVLQAPVSTFSIDVDTGSYTNTRRMIGDGSLPPEDAVRVEEFINYFQYGNPVHDSNSPFSVWTEVGPSPWNEQNSLLRITLDTPMLQKDSLKASNLVFLVDVSGSMHSPDKLALLKKSMKLLARQMGPDDSIAIVVYAGASGTVLEPVSGDETVKIEKALDELRAGGSTNGASGIQLAYQVARQAFIDGGNNRVILATDGDFNVGTVNHEALLDIVERHRHQGIALTTLGFGKGNYNDHLMEQLADHGNGSHAYIDNLFEAQKVLVDELGSTLQTVASDVKIQIEFNPQQVSEYRLIGYENRQLAREDFNNDKVDAGEIGAGHSMTALYEVTLQGQSGVLEPLRYSGAGEPDHDRHQVDSGELAFLKLRYKLPGESHSQLLSYPVMTKDRILKLNETSDDYRFAAAVAAYAQRLKGGKYLRDFSWQAMRDLAANARGDDSKGLRSNFLQMLDMTQTLDTVYQQPVAHE